MSRSFFEVPPGATIRDVNRVEDPIGEADASAHSAERRAVALAAHIGRELTLIVRDMRRSQRYSREAQGELRGLWRMTAPRDSAA